jgi:hypothetical protein
MAELVQTILDQPDEMAREIGAAWTRTGKKAGEYLSVLIDDPMLAQPIRANLFRNGEASAWALQWGRPPKRGLLWAPNTEFSKIQRKTRTTVFLDNQRIASHCRATRTI